MTIPGWFNRIRVLVCDLDGTLYQDDRFARRYLRYLLEEAGHRADEPLFLETMDQIATGDHPTCRVGMKYPGRASSPLRTDDDLPSRLQSLPSVNGNPVKPCPGWYFCGDDWGIVGMVTSILDIAESRRERAFARVRREMISGPEAIPIHTRLLGEIGSLTGLERRILMSNAPEWTARQFVSYLGVQSLFDELHFGAAKPAGMNALLGRLIWEEGFNADEILLIGDHLWNDLAPGRAVGAKTILVSAYVRESTIDWDIACSSMDGLADLIAGLRSAQTGRRMV